MNPVIGNVIGDGHGLIAHGVGQTKIAAQPQSAFAHALEVAASNMVDSLHRAEAVTIAGLESKADTRQVVEAVMAAEHSLQTAIAIRDKIVSAYLDMSRMQI